MLKSLDVLIGLSVIMLALSMAVTMMTQFTTTVLNSRGRHLKRGLADLLSQLDPALRGRIAGELANAVLTHPLVSNTRGGPGSVIHREEFTKLLLQLASSNSSLHDEAKAALLSALRSNGIEDPDATLRAVRAASLQIETASPQLASDVRQTIALLREAKSDLVGKVHTWFDQTIDRVAQRFTAETRALTFVGALLVAVALQVDTVGLVNRLAADDALRQAFVNSATAGQKTDPSTSSSIDQQYLTFLADKGLITVATTPSDWRARWGGVNMVGVLVTCLLLSLGAPFWYSALGRLLQLRSAIAFKDDDQRAARQTPDAGQKVAVMTGAPPLDGDGGDGGHGRRSHTSHKVASGRPTRLSLDKASEIREHASEFRSTLG